MSEDEYLEQIELLIKKINHSKETLWRMLDREEYDAASTLKKHIDEDKKQLLKLLSQKDSYIKSSSGNEQ